MKIESMFRQREGFVIITSISETTTRNYLFSFPLIDKQLFRHKAANVINSGFRKERSSGLWGN